MLAIFATFIRMQTATTHNSINEMTPTYGILTTTVPPSASHLPTSFKVEQRSLLLARKSGASGSHFSTYYDSGSGNLAITETIVLAQIGVRTVLTDCSNIERAVWQGNIPNLETVTVNIMGPQGPDSLSPIAICTLDKNTEQQLDWDILTPGQAWEEYNYTWILPGLFEG